MSLIATQILPKRRVDRHPQLIRPRRWVSVEGRWQGGGLIPMDGRELGDGLGWCYLGCEKKVLVKSEGKIELQGDS